MNTEQQIRNVLEAEVADLDPSPLGWDAIQRRVAGRRRLVLTRALPCIAAAAAITSLAVWVAPHIGPDRIVPNPPAASSSAVPSTGEEPLYSVWPFTVRSEVDAWERDATRASTPFDSAIDTVRAFVVDYVGLTESAVDVVEFKGGLELSMEPSGKVTTRPTGDNTSFTVSIDRAPAATVEVRDMGRDASPGPFVITSTLAVEGEAGFGLTIDHAPEDPVLSPTHTFSGRYSGAEPDDVVSVEARLRDASGRELSTGGQISFDGHRWEIALTVPPPSTRTGSLLVTELVTPARIRRFAVSLIVFGEPVAPSNASAARTSGPPSEFVAVVDGVLGRYRTTDGALVQALSEAQPGGGVFDPSIDTSGRSVAYAQGAGTCAAGIYSVPLAGGAPTELVDASRGAASDPSLNDSWLAYTLTRCNTAGDTSGDIVELLLRDLDSGEETRLATAVGANAEFSSPSWSPDGNRLAVVAAGVEGGAEARVHIYDLDQLRTPTEVGASQGCAVLAVAWMTVPGRVGSRPVTSQYCGPEGSRQARLYDSYGLPDAERAPLAVRGEIPITTLDVDVTGQHLLWSASIRNRGIEVWRWDGTTDPTRVPSAPNLEYPTW